MTSYFFSSAPCCFFLSSLCIRTCLRLSFFFSLYIFFHPPALHSQSNQNQITVIKKRKLSITTVIYISISKTNPYCQKTKYQNSSSNTKNLEKFSPAYFEKFFKFPNRSIVHVIPVSLLPYPPSP